MRFISELPRRVNSQRHGLDDFPFLCWPYAGGAPEGGGSEEGGGNCPSGCTQGRAQVLQTIVVSSEISVLVPVTFAMPLLLRQVSES